MKTSYLRAALAITLLAGLNLSAHAGLVTQDVTRALKMGSSPLPGSATRMPLIVAPLPAQIVPIESQPLPQEVIGEPVLIDAPMPALIVEPMPALLEEAMPALVNAPTAVPEPGTLATLGAGLVLMGALARRRRSAPRA